MTLDSLHCLGTFSFVYRASKDFEKKYDPNFRPMLIANDVDGLYKPAL
jgi:hypothetical protein